MTPARYIDIHLLQSIPYANLNRDDLGSPKSMTFGGVERTRVSSQSWKRAVRLALQESAGEQALRTRRVPIEVASRLRSKGWSKDLATFAGQQVAASITSKGLGLEANGGTSVLLYLPASALDDLARICEENRDDLSHAQTAKPKTGKSSTKSDPILPRDEVTRTISGRNGVINLFGRMLADVPTAHVDGAVQVAHAFTVHGTSAQVDFFTAVDDLNEAADETGSGHMNSAEFSAGTFYRYACVNLHDLTRNLEGEKALAAELAADFLTNFISAIPGAKKNSTAAFTVPDLVYIAVRGDRPVSLASAFEPPVRAPLDGGFGPKSRTVLSEYAGHIYRLIGEDGLVHHAHALTDEKGLDHLGELTPSHAALVKNAIARAGLR
ncbi:type I-E CRISPR-associated protein Cas7/Cse4/CasC [Solwaraspora sp. WMMD1047]|uniref:type I-E CRISPR-associated protein Cas7/Cse4/CasC n=1 Tax=Solwaraspora sp. WMMD1047 TaxID=3016102 RepID=UPI002415E5F8|nr:type I-E CRISPR-associated protein Cas7/Cse4/CasC [Solwaraspora sp. WMMD1047]MDG4827689.1 type I-E CRISPR-associated protein Cas7/Cse4/CasC [Solwaraspora sp. WMMD1047]MDG4834880.1 type I-E CRISPR-associated protein Cas7/Cse4/CasC [Solwaraspora sp. WMMD1047]MDG4834889.1 type I-E CRISPR-associated protein Cas7/Cse4/CasC [Solwaraspora sp. WMMD1047]